MTTHLISYSCKLCALVLFNYFFVNLCGSQDKFYTPMSHTVYVEKIVFRTDRYVPSVEICIMNPDGSDLKRLTANAATDRLPCISPDGSKIAYAALDFVAIKGAIHIMSSDGTDDVSITTAEAINEAPYWSTDGSKLVFQTNRDGNYELYTINTDGSNLQRLTNHSSWDENPAWGKIQVPDTCHKIAFYSTRNGNYDIYVMNIDGSNLTRLTTNVARDLCPEISPDGSKIAFQSNRDGNYEIYVMNIDGNNQQRLTQSTNDENHVTWSPDGEKIYFMRELGSNNSAICVIDSNGNNPQQLTSGLVRDVRPCISPDGSKILFNSTRDGNFEIYIMKIDGSNQQRLTNSTLWEVFPRWSPDGNKIAYGLFNNATIKNEVHVMNTDGSGDITLTNTGGINENPCWSPDGEQIVFQSDRDGNFELYVMNSDGSNQQRITNNSAWDGWPSWGKIQLTINHDTVGALAYAITPPDGNSEIFLINSDGSGKTQLTDEPGRPYGPAFSPDTMKIAFYNHLSNQTWSLYIMNADGSNVQRLTNATDMLDWSPDWSPDGGRILFARSFTTPVWRSEIWMINPDGSNLHKLSDVDGQGPDWSPDGSKIVYFNYVGGGGDIWVMNADGTGTVKLTDNPSEDWWPKFSPDGSKIAFQSKRDGNHEIYVMNSDGSNQVRLTNNTADDEDPNWSPDGSKIAFISMRDGHYEIYIMNSDGTNQTRITYTTGHAIDPDWKPTMIPDTISILDSVSINVRSGWNMISLPINSIYLADDLVPSPISDAFYYSPDSVKYIVEDTLKNGNGYWLKFSTDGVMKFFMDSTFADTINLKEGWNMVGSVSMAVPVNTIISDPPGMVTSEFFTYLSGYIESNTIIPGTGYWVKVEQPGQLILSASGHISPLQFITIVQDDETPPLPPFELMSEDDKSVPSSLVLYQNYPNPFNPSTTIHFDIPVKSHIKLDVFNILGMHIKKLVDEIRDAVSYNVAWDGTDDLKNQVSSGLYLFKLTSGNYSRVQKALLLR